MKTKITRFAGLAALLASIPCARAQSLLLDYRFDGSGATVANGGSLDATLEFKNKDGQPANLHTTGQKGLSGQPGDEAFNNNASTDMGSNGVGGAAKSNGGVSLGNVSSFTLSGWFYAEEKSLRAGARILDISPLINLTAGGDGILSLYVNSSSVAASSPASPAYQVVGRWVFFAVTYDSGPASDNVAFYVGTESEDVIRVGTATYPRGTIAASASASLAIGNNNGGHIRPFDGFLDNIQLRGSQTGSSGALSQEQIEAVRVSTRAQSLLLDYNFNETGATVLNGGTLGAHADLQFTNPNGQAVDLHTTGSSGDEAFDNSASTGMGSGHTGGAAKSDGAVSLGDVSSFTLTGWFYAASDSFRAGARLLDISPMINLTAGGNGVLSLYVNSTSAAAISPASPDYQQVGRWVFFAATYDSAPTSDNVAFYVGDESSSVTRVGTATYPRGAIAASASAGLAIGNNNGGHIRPFDGYLDNIQLYGKPTGNKGAFSREQIETIRVSALSDEWTDEATGHRVERISRLPGTSNIQYFHQNAFTRDGDLMLFSNTSPAGSRRLYTVDLQTHRTRQVTDRDTSSMYMPEVAPVSRNVYYLRGDGEICETNLDTLATRVVAVIPPDWRQGKGFSINADETLLAGCVALGEAGFIAQYYPDTARMTAEIFKARLDNFIYIVSIQTGEIEIIHNGNDWFGHVQFSPTDPTLLMFCHEGPWEQVDRVWTIRTDGTELTKRYTRASPENGERVAHEFWSGNGQSIWYDWAARIGGNPATEGNAIGMTDLATGAQTRWPLTDSLHWSMHYAASSDQTLFAGDGFRTPQGQGSNTSQWIFLFEKQNGRMAATRLADMSRHDYATGPNVRFSPDGKKIFFQGNQRGGDQIYAVEIDK